MGVRTQLLAVSVGAFIAVAAVGTVSFFVIVRERAAADRLAVLSRTQRILQDADKEQDAIRADVLAIDNRWVNGTPQELQRRLAADIDRYRAYLLSAEAMPVDAPLRKAIADIEPDLDAYLRRADEATHLQADAREVSDMGRAFQESYERLSAHNKQVTDLFAGRVTEAAAAADEAARSAFWAIGSASLAALCMVAIVGRLVTGSVSRNLGRVRAAAEAISAGDLSVRTAVARQDDIGAVAVAVNKMADTLQTMIGKLQAEQEQDAFSRQLSEVLEMADTETDTHLVVSRAMAAVTTEMPMELLVADSSRAHLERATVHPGKGAPGCDVVSPFGCMAVRRGNPIVFDDSEALNACSHLQGRACGPISAVCVPLSFMGRSLGVLHATGSVNKATPPKVVSQLTTLGILAGTRIGTVRAFERTQIQARTDGLTGLANRRAFESRVRNIGQGAAYAFVLADLDHFKRLNDKHGHDAGDNALRVFADVLRQSLRDSDLSARWGGEEFGILLEGRDAAGALIIVDRIRANMAAGMQGAPAVTASFGIADTTMADTFEQLTKIADDALYEAKEGGRNRGVIGNPARVSQGMPRRSTEHAAAVNVDAVAAMSESPAA